MSLMISSVVSSVAGLVADPLAVAHYCYFVGYAKYLRHFVRDIDYCAAAVALSILIILKRCSTSSSVSDEVGSSNTMTFEL